MKKVPLVFAILTLLVVCLYGCSATDTESKQKNGDDVRVNNKTIEPDKLLRVHFIDVGKADSILIQTSESKTMLIDAGNKSDGDMIVSYLKSQGISKVDVVVGTHPHKDHIGSLDTVIKNFDIGSVYMPKIDSDTETYEDVLEAIKDKGLEVMTATAGLNVALDPSLKVEMFAPNSDSYEEVNNYSAVIKLTYKNTSFLFAGDAQSISEQEMLSKSYDLKADILKVGHHGSSAATTEAFLEKVFPKYAVISVGEDEGNVLPDDATLNKLKTFGVEVFRTDEAGTIIATSDGNTIKFDKKASVIIEDAPTPKK